MRETFSEYCLHTEEEKKQIWEECIFVPDTNVLLDLYRYNVSARDQLLDIFESIKERLWIPHQVAMEYMRNRHSLLIGQYTHYKQCKSFIHNLSDVISESFSNNKSLENHQKHPITELKNKIVSLLNDFDKTLDEAEESADKFPTNDYVFDRLCEITEGKVGKELSENDLSKIFEEGKKRYENKIPPGYRDGTGDKKKNGNDIYGDFVLWKQVLLQSHQVEKSVIIITGESGEDWWWNVKGRSIGPRLEMIREFREHTNQNYYQYETPQFMRVAKQILNAHVDDTSIKDAQDLRDDYVRYQHGPFGWREDMSRELQDHMIRLHIHIDGFFRTGSYSIPSIVTDLSESQRIMMKHISRIDDVTTKSIALELATDLLKQETVLRVGEEMTATIADNIMRLTNEISFFVTE